MRGLPLSLVLIFKSSLDLDKVPLDWKMRKRKGETAGLFA